MCFGVLLSDRLTNERTDICTSRVDFATEKFAGGGGLFDYSVTPGPGPDLELDNTEYFLYQLLNQ